MIIEIDTEGGFAGIAAVSQHKRIDVDAQPEPIRQDLSEAFHTRRLQRLAATDCSDCADRVTYRISVTMTGQHRQSFILREDQLPAEMLDLIDRL